MVEKFIQITSGRGPQECSLAVRKISDIFMKEAIIKGLQIQKVKEEKDNGTVCSVTFQLHGESIDLFLKSWSGTIQWICNSPIRPHHKRKNWYIKAHEILNNDNDIEIPMYHIHFETMRSSGAGGQHVNKMSSAVRATHIPTGISVQVMDTRSQLQNKVIAIERLNKKLQDIYQAKKQSLQSQNWTNQIDIERGNPVRTFYGKDFKEK